MGGEQAEYRVEVDPARLAAYGLTFSDVADALSASNVLQAVGRLEDRYKLYLLLSDTRIQSLRAIDDTVLRSGADGLVRLEDIARVYAATVPQWLRVTADGRDCGAAADLPAARRQHGADRRRGQAATLQAYRDKLPDGVQIANWYDQSQLIVASAASVRDAIGIGVVLAALVLFVFLRSLKITLVAMLVVPAVLASTVLLLTVLDMSFNIMTLGGMAAAVGLVVDDAIVMIEHIMRRLRERRGDLALHRARGGDRVYAAAGRIVGRHHHHLRAAGVSGRRDRRLFQGAVADHGQQPVHFLSGGLAGGAAAGGTSAARPR